MFSVSCIFLAVVCIVSGDSDVPTSLSDCGNYGKNDSSAVSEFISAVNKDADDSSFLSSTEQLDQGQVNAFKVFVTVYTSNRIRQLGIPDPIGEAFLVAKPIQTCFDTLDFQTFLQIGVKCIARNLASNGILNSNNADQLAKDLVDHYEETAKFTAKDGEPKSKFESLWIGGIEFLKSEGLYVKDKVPKLVSDFRCQLLLDGNCSQLSS